MKPYASDIAIVGMACRFPGANDYRQYWDNLAKGVNSIRTIPADRWDIAKYYSPDIDEPNKSVSKWCGIIDNVDRFDSQFFNIPAHEAKQLDPQQRILLEETWHCLEDSGIALKELQHKPTAVYIGAMNTDYRQRFSADMETDSYACLGNFEGMLANRISHTFHFSGASLSINAACASSLIAVHEAKRALLAGECDYALAGGVNLNLHPWKYISFSKARMLSPDGQCKTFDQEANGYVPGDGAGVVLLQRLEDAIKDGNHIYGILKGSAVNHGGKALSVTAPRVEAQRSVILAAYADAGVSPAGTGYVEAHGTGTSLGDPIEIEALTQAFREYTNSRSYCKIGSVKTNIGHLEAAAGIAGLIKVLLMMKHRHIPRHLNLKTVNPMIDFAASPFTVATEPAAWQQLDSQVPLRAGVSSFGFGGANAHIVVEEYTGRDEPKQAKQPQIFALSAKTAEGLNRLRENWRAFAADSGVRDAGLADISATLLTGRVALPWRIGTIVSGKEELADWLSRAACVPQSGQTQDWCLAVGAAAWNGYRESARAETLDKRLDDTIRFVLGRLSAIGADDKLTSGFYAEKWPEAARPLYAFIMHYALHHTLSAYGPKPNLIAGEGGGIWLSLVLSGMLELDAALAHLAGLRRADELALARPKVPFYDPVANRIIEPYLITDTYLRRLLDGLETPDREIISAHFAKARMLKQNQHTFKRYLADWEHALSTGGLQLDEMLEKTKADGWEKSRNELLLLLIVVLNSLHRLNRKWNLTEDNRITAPYFNELLQLVNDEALAREDLVTLFLDEHSDLRAIAKTLHERQGRLRNKADYPCLAAENRAVGEIGDAAGWLKAAADCTLDEANFGERRILQSGELKAAINPAVKARCEGHPAELCRETLLAIWLAGGDVEWEEMFTPGSFRKVALPTTVFLGESHWLPQHEAAAQATAEEMKPKLALKPIAASAEPKISLKPLQADGAAQNPAGILARITAIFSEILDMDKAELAPDTDLLDLGIDSISGVEAIRDINQAFGLNLEAVIVYDYPTLAELSEYVQKALQKK
ncbi:MAG TPA: beta-ketoacyl synthase N-terminal-like domain-containing protein [Bacilli bacterium]